ncbi:hypothetical protein [Pelagibacterium sp. H642]|uniref:hypothetical protein n=1 Tax=Pelagibacterium sp. H642 TaxID=1881069 RepID=UPI002815BAE4|nr:hypothetical protein [Pelagibacterium sp. H642]WMT89559.1 hypothetical protein NO934_12225 [Pelagibacterium sp. H642]
MDSNTRHAFALMNEETERPESQEKKPAQPDRVQFSLAKNGISVSAAVSVQYFETKVLPIMTKLLAEIAGEADATPAEQPEAPQETRPERFRNKERPSIRQIIEMLEAKSGPEVVKAAAISLTLFQQTPIFTRERLLSEAETAIGHWRKVHAKTADVILDYLLASGFLVERGNGELCMNPEEEKAAILGLRKRD